VRLRGTVELAESVECGAAYAGLRSLQPEPYEPAPAGCVEHIRCVEQPVDQSIAVARLELSGVAQQVLQPLRVSVQRAPRSPPSQRRLEAGAVLSKRVLVDGVGAAAPIAEIDFQPLRETQVSG